MSQQRFPSAGFAQARTPDWVVLARDDVFADAMAGASLTGNAPLLFTGRAELPEVTAEEVDRLLEPGDLVLLLGGPEAIAPSVAEGLEVAGYAVQRLAGPTRVETALAVADHLASQPSTRQAVGAREVFLARAYGPPDRQPWGDAISVGALAARTARPILLTTSDVLAPEVGEWISEHAGLVSIVGGTEAISEQVRSQLDEPRRLAGADRAGTAVVLATDLWTDAASGGYQLAAANHPDGWMLALAGAGLAADEGTPLLLTNVDQLPSATAQLLACEDGAPPPVRALGGDALISQEVLDQIGGCAAA